MTAEMLGGFSFSLVRVFKNTVDFRARILLDFEVRIENFRLGGGVAEMEGDFMLLEDCVLAALFRKFACGKKIFARRMCFSGRLLQGRKWEEIQ